MNKPLLDYSVTSTPSPLHTSQVGQITVTVSNSSDGPIDLAEVFIGVVVGNAADGLAAGLDGVNLLASNGWVIEAKGANAFSAKPPQGKSQPIGQNGLEFILSNIPVNPFPGTTIVSIDEKAEVSGKSRYGSQEFSLVKTFPSLELDGPNAAPLAVDYGGECLISWQATHGATIILEVDGKTIDHVAGQSGTPLPATGSYTLKNMTRPDTVVSCTAKLASQTGNATKTGQITLTMNPPQIKAFETSRGAADPSKIKVTWDTVSAKDVELAIGTQPAVTESGKGSYTPPHGTSLFETAVTLSAKNPVASVSKTLSQGVAVCNWTRVADGPDIAPESNTVLLQIGSKLGLLAFPPEKADGEGLLYLSDDALLWNAPEKVPKIGYEPIFSSAISTPDGLYIPAGKPSSESTFPEGFVLLRRDAATGVWSKTPNVNLQHGGCSTLTLGADRNGNVYTSPLGEFVDGFMYVSQNRGETWKNFSGFAPLLMAFRGSTTTLQLVGDDFWFAGGALETVGDPAIFSRVVVQLNKPFDAGRKHHWSNGALRNVNRQSAVSNKTLYMLNSPSDLNDKGLQLFKTGIDGKVTGFAPSPDAKVNNPDGKLHNIGFTSFKGLFFASAGSSYLPGGGIWMFNQPDF